MRTLLRRPGILCLSLGTAIAASCGGSTDATGDGDGDGISGDGDSIGGDGDLGPGGESGKNTDEMPSAFCKSDKDCRESDGVCDTSRSVCVECVSDTECSDNSQCVNSVCIAITPCDSSKDCTTDEVCSDTLQICVECEGDNDCEGEQVCVANACSTSCSSDKDCRDSDQVCSAGQSICVRCNSDDDCAEAEFCQAGMCADDACQSGASTCDGENSVVCNEQGSAFVSTHCPNGCSDGTCDTQDCLEGDEGCTCYPNDTCNSELTCLSNLCVDAGGSGGASGSGGMSSGGMSSGGSGSGGMSSGGMSSGGSSSGGMSSGGTSSGGTSSGGSDGSGGSGCNNGDEGCSCYPNQTCNADLTCEDGMCFDLSGSGGTSSGGSGSGGTGSGGSGPVECAEPTGNHCSSIPKFVGTQTIDGNGEEFCNIPAQVLTYATAEYQNLEGYTGDTSVIEATFRVAWDDTAMRAHVHVKDPNVLHGGVSWYDGDSTQLYFAAVTPTTGPPDYDNGAVQIGVPIKNTNPVIYAGDPYGSLVAEHRLVDDGYEVELAWTWGTNEFLSPDVPGAGDTIAFNLMIGAQENTVINGDLNYRDFEFGLAYKDGVFGVDELYKDTQVWCTPTLAAGTQ